MFTYIVSTAVRPGFLRIFVIVAHIVVFRAGELRIIVSRVVVSRIVVSRIVVSRVFVSRVVVSRVVVSCIDVSYMKFSHVVDARMSVPRTLVQVSLTAFFHVVH